jgi:ribosomal protein S6E (S10)
MIGGAAITEQVRASAKELITSAHLEGMRSASKAKGERRKRKSRGEEISH